MYAQNVRNSEDTLEDDMRYAMIMADTYFDKLNDIEDEKNNISTIIQ
jgi:hypothetical protein